MHACPPQSQSCGSPGFAGLLLPGAAQGSQPAAARRPHDTGRGGAHAAGGAAHGREAAAGAEGGLLHEHAPGSFQGTGPTLHSRQRRVCLSGVPALHSPTCAAQMQVLQMLVYSPACLLNSIPGGDILIVQLPMKLWVLLLYTTGRQPGTSGQAGCYPPTAAGDERAAEQRAAGGKCAITGCTYHDQCMGGMASRNTLSRRYTKPCRRAWPGSRQLKWLCWSSLRRWVS
jgi:hypothetical protein